MSRCKNKVSQFVPKGYGYKEVKLPCGSTDIHGGQLICDECEEQASREYPQGWKDIPGDLCKHGNYVGTPGGVDYMCGQCENE